MNATIYSHNQIIGQANLTIGDETMGHLYGTFVPGPDYRAVQNIVRKFSSHIDRDYSEWKALGLNVQLENGFFMLPVGGIDICDSEEFPSEAKRIDIAGVNSEVITDYFKTNPPKTFVHEPWGALDITTKLAIERQLEIEVGDRLTFNNTSRKHQLLSYEYSALCASLLCDDVLFAVHGREDAPGSYALVHLTWSNQKEHNPEYPATTFFETFDEFSVKRMLQDNIDFGS